LTSKTQQSEQTKWQSPLLVIAVVPVCGIAVSLFSLSHWTYEVETALAIALLFGAVAWLSKAATPAAAATGAVLAAGMILPDVAGGDPWWRTTLWPLLSLFLLTFAATRFGRSSKEKLGLAESRRGRNAAQVVANLGVAAWMGTIQTANSLVHAGLPPEVPFARIMMLAALAEATADTISSEIGTSAGGVPVMVTTGKRVAPGTDGAVSLTGTLVGSLAALCIIGIGIATPGLSWRGAIAAFAGAIGGLFVDSLLGATLERRNWLNNDAVNFLSTLASAFLALAFALI
jgi:uncharacterized protein (TIGR00297 family)